jgi:V/A-type H+-transporting ATPase subunit A
LRDRSMKLLQKEAELKDIVQLVGADALPDAERVTLEVGRMIREYFLRQNAFDEVDAFTTLNKQRRMIEVMLHFKDKAEDALAAGVSADRIMAAKVKVPISRMSEIKESDIDKRAKSIEGEIDSEFNEMMKS